MEMESNLMNAYLAAYSLACKELGTRNPVDIGLNTDSVYDSESNTLVLTYLNNRYSVNCNTGNIEMIDCAQEVTTTVKVLILHYLLNAKAQPLTGNFVSFREIPGGGAIYNQTFLKRAVSPLVKTFGNNIDGFMEAAYRLNGVKEKFGHVSATLRIFPLVPVTYTLWQGDEEIPPSGTILFDDSVTSFLPVEDIVIAASFGVYELMSQFKDKK